jgi:hypothetical protein
MSFMETHLLMEFDFPKPTKFPYGNYMSFFSFRFGPGMKNGKHREDFPAEKGKEEAVPSTR